MADTETAVVETQNTVTVEDAGPALKRISITIPAESVDAKLGDSLATLSTQAQIPGFRKGKVPRSLLERRFGESIRREAKSQLVGSAYSTALETHGIKPLGQPIFDQAAMEAPLEDGKPLTFVLDVEVVPTFDLPPLKGLEIKRPMADVTDEHIEIEVKKTMLRVGTAVRVTGKLGPGDRVLAKAVVRKEGVEAPIFQTDRALVVIPEADEGDDGQVLGLLISGLRSLLDGRSLGDSLTVETVGPEAHEREDIRNAKLTIELTLIDAEHITPATLDEVISRFGLDDEASLREQVRIALEQRRDLEQQAAMREQVYEHLLRNVDFPLPERLSSEQHTRAVERQRIELLYRGVEPNQVEMQLASMRASTEAQSRTRLKLLFILAAYAQNLGIEVSEQEVDGRIAAIARQRGQRPHEVKAEFERSGHLGEVAVQIREQRTGDRLLDDCTIVDMPAAEWNAQVAARHAEAAGAR